MARLKWWHDSSSRSPPSPLCSDSMRPRWKCTSADSGSFSFVSLRTCLRRWMACSRDSVASLRNASAKSAVTRVDPCALLSAERCGRKEHACLCVRTCASALALPPSLLHSPCLCLSRPLPLPLSPVFSLSLVFLFLSLSISPSLPPSL